MRAQLITAIAKENLEVGYDVTNNKMKSHYISFVMALASLVLAQSSPKTPEKKPAQEIQTQPPTNGAKRSLLIDYGEYTVKPPAGRGWQEITDPNKTPDSLVEFNNADLKAWASVEERVSRHPVTDIQANLLSLSENMRKAFESKARVIHFESTIRTVGGRECLFTIAIVNPKQALPGVPPNANQVSHTLNCFYRTRTDPSDHLVGLIYANTANGEADPQKEQAEEFFAGLQFKEPSAR